MALFFRKARKVVLHLWNTKIKKKYIKRALLPLLWLRLRRKRGTVKKIRTIKSTVDKSKATKRDRFEYHRDNLVNLGVLGKGFYGVVTLQMDPQTGSKFALKAVSKGFSALHGMVPHLTNEKRVMQTMDSPFLVRLAATFDRPQHIEFLMEASMGGELFTVYQRNNFYGNETMTRFFTACIGAGLAHLHSKNVAHRDLKPENVLLDSRGYAKICDFGLAKFVEAPAYKLHTVCGTTEYFAPELDDPRGYTLAVDWWSLGVITFGLMMGRLPFQPRDPMNMLKLVKTGLKDSKFRGASGPWTDFVRDMLQQEPANRLPMRAGGFNNFEAHPWYQAEDLIHWDWRRFYQQSLEPPWTPPLQDANNLNNFDPDAVADPPDIPCQDSSINWAALFHDPIGPLPNSFRQ